MPGVAAKGSAAAGRHEFLLLDGLRGIAALAVMFYHMQNWFAGGFLFSHGYVAVDFFFVLSGFVVAHAYSGKVQRPGGILAFTRARIIRLYPLLLLGAGVGSAIYLVRLHAQGVAIDGLALANCLAGLIPFPALWNSGLFPIDPPVWSLFWELIVNVAFALMLVRLRSAWLVAVLVGLGVLLIVKGISSGGVEFGPLRQNWELGGARAFYGFIWGMLMLRWLRTHPPQRKRRQFWPIGALVLMLAWFPLHGIWSTLYDLLLIILINPLVVFAAARSAPIAPRLESWSGAMSYPLYIFHLPVLMLIGGILTRLHIADHVPKWLIGLLLAALLIMLAEALDRWFDVPLRRYLSRRFA